MATSSRIFIAFARKRAQEIAVPRAHEDTPAGGTVLLLAHPVAARPPGAEPALGLTPTPVLVS
ncbi:MAG TPA: hypothetical protein VF524_01180 [Polyangia bacterium]